MRKQDANSELSTLRENNQTPSKAQDAGKVYVEVDSKDTAQECSRCSVTVHKTLAAREHSCCHCGLRLPRGVNAARNVRKRAEAELGTMV